MPPNTATITKVKMSSIAPYNPHNSHENMAQPTQVALNHSNELKNANPI